MNEIINICGVDCYEKDGVAYLKLETVARGLGFTTVAASGNEVVRWNVVYGYLTDLKVVAGSCNGNYRENCPEFIPENIFYRLAMKAKNETAEKFQAKVADEIIPSIRRTGGYIAGEENLSDDELIARALIIAQNKLAEREKVIKEKQKRIEEMRPKEIFADAVSVSNTSILIGELAKILKQNGVDTGQNRLFEWMRGNGYLVKRKGNDYNMPMQKSMEMGLFEIKERTITNPDGSVRITKTVLVTGKGQQYFINKLLEEAA